MADRFSKKQRSLLMSKIKSSRTVPELLLKNRLKHFIYQPKLPGRPDFVNFESRIAIFMDGCFWHCCPIHFRKPKSNKYYWHVKLLRNKVRGMEIDISYKMSGWKVIRIWEHDVKCNFAHKWKALKSKISSPK